MAKSDARFGYRAKTNREAHDLGAAFGFTAAPGMCLPCFADIATPGDTYYFEHNLEYLRTLPFATPAMVDVKIHFETFFVPFQMIYQPIEQTLFSLKQIQSSLYNMNNLQNTNLPVCPYDIFANDMIGTPARNHSKLHADAFRLADMLGLNADSFAWDANNTSRFKWLPRFFPWQLLAYRTIFEYYYRLDDKTQFKQTGNYDSSYNEIDYGSMSDDLWTIYQRPWDFDYFTSMYRSPIVSDASVQSVMNSSAYSSLVGNSVGTSGLDRFGNLTDVNSDKVAFTTNIAGVVSEKQLDLQASTAMIRQMFANEKLAMITGRARKTYDSQVLAHFGVEVPHDPKHDISVIGTDEYKLQVGEVTSLAATSDAGLGDLAGKGWANGKGRKHKFTCPCHGVVMTIFSIEPVKRYYGGFDRINAVSTAFDIPTPEYDRLGNMPMFRYEAGENAGSGTVTPLDIIGWKERFYYSKRRHPKVTLAFQNGTANQGINEYGSYMLTSTPFGAYTSTNNFTARPDLESRFYIDRNCMDALMLTPYINVWQTGGLDEETDENWNKTPWLAYRRDPFIIDYNPRITKVSWMSKDGEPIYNY